ncbi:MAG: YceI family protein [Betaproteobacteria bacterium]|nr:YceI family protein [Betaproteobacteria bacterium]
MNRITLNKTAIALTIAAAFSLPALAAPETYNIDNGHSMPRFSYTHMGFSTQMQRFDKVSGVITLDRAAKTGSVDVTIDTKSIDTGSELFNGHLKGEDFFNAEKFPTITYKSSSMKFEGDKPVAVEGTLTIKGVSKPVTLTLSAVNCAPHPMMKKDACGALAVTTVKRSDFNMGKYAPAVSDEVTITIPVEAIKS